MESWKNTGSLQQTDELSAESVIGEVMAPGESWDAVKGQQVGQFGKEPGSTDKGVVKWLSQGCVGSETSEQEEGEWTREEGASGCMHRGERQSSEQGYKNPWL